MDHRKEEKMPDKICSLCGGELQRGSILAPSLSAVGSVVQPNEAKWYAGSATRIGPRHKLPHPEHIISAYRCSDCGHLELFAH